MNKTDPRERSDKYRKHITVKFNNAKQFEFAPTQFLIDENYVGNPPRVQISFENLNDNIDENFLRRDLEKLGKIRTINIVRHPETRQHLGLAKVQFEDPKVASCCVDTFNGKQVMGKQLSVYHDVRFATIERRKEERMRPQPAHHVEAPRLQALPKPLLPVFPQIPFPAVIPPSPLDALPRSVNRQHTSLDERLAKLGLKQTSSFPSTTPPSHLTLDKSAAPIHFLQNHISKGSQEKRLEEYPPARTKEEEDRLWNPVTSSDPHPLPSPVDEITLTKIEIAEDVMPYIRDKFFEDLRKNLHDTLKRRLVFDYGYPCIDEAQRVYRQEEDRERMAKAKAESHRRQILNEQRYFNKDRVDIKPMLERGPRPQMIRQRVSVKPHTQDDRITDNDLKRVNRSAALAHEQVKQRQSSEESRSDRSYRHSRPLHRQRLYSGSRSNSRSSRESSSSYSRDSSSASSDRSSSSSVSSPSSITSHSTSSSQCSEPRGVFKMETSTDFRSTQSHADLASDAALEAEKALEAATALVSLNVHPVDQNIKTGNEEPVSLKPIPKKRKKKDADQENHDSKRIKSLDESYGNELISPKKKVNLEDRKPLVFNCRSRDVIDMMKNDLYSIDEEDLKYLRKVHQDWEEKNESTDQTRVPFGSEHANRAHLISFKEQKKEIESKTHPRWWNGCSRCSLIKKGDRGKVEEEEMTYEDLTKAPIKSHVIQAAVSTRRDQRSDQRRIAALNPEIDPAFLKQFTANTLQMRAKNLRFSRSKIHQWGLFACEKIANGDAVIEYVGEKIRHSVADHRELVVYPSLSNHDGSSYFFRVDTDVIDASFKGNKARFINHSCNPNCIAKIIKHENGTNSIVIYAKQTINEDEEITYDYKFPREANPEDKIRCNCKAPKCHVWLN